MWTLVVEREPEYSEDDRTRLLGLDYFRNTVGPCGYSHEFVSNDPDLVFEPVDSKCPLCAHLAHYDRVRGKQEENAEKDKPSTAKRPSDGRSTHIRILPPDEAAERLAKKEGKGGNSPRTRRPRTPR